MKRATGSEEHGIMDYGLWIFYSNYGNITWNMLILQSKNPSSIIHHPSANVRVVSG
jgi:hypothetical protein